jgi:DEAD/DEAH box helicase domain-containing protein
LFPTKALSQDQLTSLRATSDAPSAIHTYDGDTPTSQRADIRRDARVIITNADMLHVGILPHHTRWSSFLRNLRYVVIDEMHMYRGVFGSHVANVIRRLKRLCAFYGAAPTFILASATIANPREHAERLIEAPVTLVDDDGSPHGEQHVLVVNPPLIAEMMAQGIRRSSLLVARDIAAQMVSADAQTICFARSRQDTELLLNYLRGVTSSVAGYRGGYLPEERRTIEAGLRSGELRAVVATNALEVGIDIGELDACVMHGYPGSIASFWQQAGRAGRRRNASVSVMVASANALDQYLAAHPNYLFEQSPEHARVAPDNLGVLAAHVRCAAFELPFERGEKLGDSDVSELLDVLSEDGEIHASGDARDLPLFANGVETDSTQKQSTRYTWVGGGYPADRVSLRGVGERVLIKNERDEIIGETERATAPVRVHLGALYLHQAEMYLVRELDWQAGVARAYRTQLDYYTRAASNAEVIVLNEFGDAVTTPQQPHVGEIQVTTRATRFQKIQFNTHHVLDVGEIDLPAQELMTTGYWFSLTEEQAKQLSKEGVIKLPNDYGPNWQQQRNLARERDGYRCVVCGKPESALRQHDVHHKIPFRKFGYINGENENYKQANQLDNLMTVCTDCHARVETADSQPTGLDGLAYVLGNIAPLIVMCDRSDIACVADWRSPHTKLPTITLYEMTPGGVGLSDELARHHDELLRMSAQRARECACERGCPACVGPTVEPTDPDTTPRNLKHDTLRVIEALSVISTKGRNPCEVTL